MANPEHVEVVLQDFKAIEKWREKNPGIMLDLRNAELYGVDLQGADLSSADLSNAIIYDSDLRFANLNNANLSNAKLSNSILDKADLFETNFQNAIIQRTCFNKAVSSAAIFDGADLRESDLQYAQMDRTSLIKSDLRKANLIGANLREANLHEANLSGANFSRADMNWANLCETNLSETIFNETNLENSNLSHSLLFMTQFNESNLLGAIFDRTELLNTGWINVDLSKTVGLSTVFHHGRSSIGIDTLMKSQGIVPEVFLRGCGLSDSLISYIPSLFANSAIEFYSCFISYNHQDKAFACRLYDALQGRGIRCWRDEHQILPGDNIYERIDHGIRVWDKVLLCASKHSLTSGWVDDELKHAFAKEKQLFKDRGCEVLSLIPLNLDGYLFSDWIHPKRNQILERMAPDFTGWDSDNAKFEQQLERVVKALQTNNTGREPEPKPKL
mgnify:CR=1 FL=1